MSLPAFAVATPSRGLVHSRTVEAVLGNVAEATAAGIAFRGWHLSHDLPIPDCHEHVAEQALAAGAKVVWFVEEDVIPPPGALLASLAMLPEFGVVAIDYPCGEPEHGWSCIMRDRSREILFVGLGCTLVLGDVLAAVPRPWFRTDMQYVHFGDLWYIQRLPNTEITTRRTVKIYGYHDHGFGYAIHEAGFRIGEVTGMTAGHALVRAHGALGSNVGYHDILVRDRIFRRWPEGTPA